MCKDGWFVGSPANMQCLEAHLTIAAWTTSHQASLQYGDHIFGKAKKLGAKFSELANARRKWGQNKKKSRRGCAVKTFGWLPIPKAGLTFRDFRLQCIDEVRGWGVRARVPPELRQDDCQLEKAIKRTLFENMYSAVYESVRPQHLKELLERLAVRAIQIFRYRLNRAAAKTLGLLLSHKLSLWYPEVWHRVDSLRAKVRLCNWLDVNVDLKYCPDNRMRRKQFDYSFSHKPFQWFEGVAGDLRRIAQSLTDEEAGARRCANAEAWPEEEYERIEAGVRYSMFGMKNALGQLHCILNHQQSEDAISD